MSARSMARPAKRNECDRAGWQRNIDPIVEHTGIRGLRKQHVKHQMLGPDDLVDALDMTFLRGPGTKRYGCRRDVVAKRSDRWIEVVIGFAR
jgi:hypothetical protein